MSSNTFSRVGFILATAGSAIGLGNIWRFPYLMANHGGGNFVILYLFFALTIGLFLMLAEFTVGRYLGNPVTENFSKLKHSHIFSKLTFIFPFVAITILSYYFVVAGWTFYYVGASLTGIIDYSQSAANSSYFADSFTALLGKPFLLITFALLFIVVTGYINYKGVEKGIEKINNIFLPLLIILMALLIIRILFLDGATAGLKYFISFKLSEINLDIVFAALGQAFFSLSLGMGTLMIYSSYTKKDINLAKSSRATVLLDSAIALFASALIIPAVFAFSFDLNSGAGLAFITIPAVFANIPIGFLFAALFFLILSIAALTSTISLLECTIPFTQKVLKSSREKAIIASLLVIIPLVIIQSLSFSSLSNITILGLGLFDFFADFFTNFLFIFSVTLVCIMAGFGLNKEDLKNEITNNGAIPFKGFEIWLFTVKYIIPFITIGIVIKTISELF